MLLGEDGADEAGDGIAVGDNPDHVRAAADLSIQPFLGVVRCVVGAEPLLVTSDAHHGLVDAITANAVPSAGLSDGESRR